MRGDRQAEEGEVNTTKLPDYELWPISIYAKGSDEFHGRYIQFLGLDTRIKFHSVSFEEKGRTYYWYIPLPPDLKLCSAKDES